jgi:hypothetical protein
MKKTLIILVFGAFCASFLNAQTVNEKKIAGFPELNTVDAYSFKFDPQNGIYFYSSYDTVTQKYSLYSNKGNSKQYNSIFDYNGIIDKQGNYYVTASNNIDTVYTYYLLKNGEEIASFDYMDASMAEKNGIIYFSCKENEKYHFAEYNTSDGTLRKSSPYDEIYFVYYPATYYEEEPIGTVGFTTDGKPYYLAGLNNERFMVIGGAEQKHYSDIDVYNFATDKNGTLVYFAKDKGKLYEEKGNTFAVQGDKEYKKFDYLYGPILFDNNNTPIYIGSDSAGDYNYPQRVVTGNTEGKTYTSGISDVKFTPKGKLAYVASNIINADKGIYESYMVIDGKESKHYRWISYLSFLADDTPVFFGNRGDNKPGVIVKGTEETETEYPDLYELKVLNNGDLSYVEVKYGNYEKKQKDKYRVVIGDEDFGPYDGMQSMYWNNGAYVLTDKNGNYAFITMKLIDAVNYTYENRLYTNTAKSRTSEYFDNVYLFKGKALFTTSILIDKVNYVYNYTLYYGDRQIGSVYNSINDFKLDEKSSTATFKAAKGKDLYFVEVKF